MEKTKSRRFELPREFESIIEEILKSYNVRFSDSKTIAAAIKKMSDFYISNPNAKTPWHEVWAVIAQLTYFLPLNFLRAQAVVAEGEKLGFFSGLQSANEIGSGLGALTISLHQIIKDISCLEISKKANELHLKISKQKIQFLNNKKQLNADLLALSYVLTEVPQFDEIFKKFKAIMIIEPSTSQDARKLMGLREHLIKSGYHIWAPCTHQKNCPLLIESKKDWCHDRIHLDMPKWFKNIEEHLPFKNKTVTFSYLLARKNLKPKEMPSLARVTGDLLPEKGKTRIMVCRRDKREFLTWLSKDKIENQFLKEIQRGDLVELNDFSIEEKSNELRLKK